MAVGMENDLPMTSDEFRMIRDFIHERSGLFFAENKMYLVKNRLQKRMEELDIKTVRDYFYHVKYDTSQKEFNVLMDLVTTNETSFFRNEPQLLSFSDEALSLVLKRKAERGQKTLRIWSAGCSTGEEPYTLAMILIDKIPNLTAWNAEIIASDISEEVLQKARMGIYSGLTLRNVNQVALSKHFVREGDNYRVNPAVRSLVKFSHLNLNDQRKISLMSDLDVVFCRNVMIYFSDDVKRQLVRGVFNSLVPGGYFYIGHSETLHGISKAFKLVYFKNALVYQKDVAELSSRSRPTASTGTQTSASSASGGAARALDLLSKIKQPAAK